MLLVEAIFVKNIFSRDSHVTLSYGNAFRNTSDSKEVDFIYGKRLTGLVICMRSLDEEVSILIDEFNKSKLLQSCVIESLTIIQIELSSSPLNGILSQVYVKHIIVLKCFKCTHSSDVLACDD